MSLSAINFKKRLEVLMNHLGDNAFLITSQAQAVRNRTVEHPYRQSSLMHYYLGFDEPQSALLVNPANKSGQRVVLFLRDKDPLAELWNGRRLGVLEAKEKLAIEQAYSIEALWTMLPELLRGVEGLYYELGPNPEYDQKVVASARKIRDRKSNRVLSFHDPEAVAALQRQFKGPEEIERMEKAAEITASTYKKIYAETRPGMNEREIYGLIQGEFYRLGADMEAYQTIVAGGANACILHYVENNQTLQNNQLLLVDAGAQFDYYAADVTRTFPIGKTFTRAQRLLYEVVLDAQLAGIEQAKPGSTLDAIHQASVSVLVEGLIELKLLQGKKDELIANGKFRTFYPHSTSHWIGMDVHDIGSYQTNQQHRLLEPGMYFSVEPGLYCDPNDRTIPEEFRGIGIRIEDDVLITPTGHKVLTCAIPKTVKELENR